MILRFLGEILLIYILYKLVFDFIIPIYQTTRRVKRQFGEMNDKMQEKMNSDRYRDNQQQNSPWSKSTQDPVNNEEFIDYEEIK